VGDAERAAKRWCNDKNKIVYGTYTFLEHNVKPVPRVSQMINTEKVTLKFKVRFQVTKRNTRWINYTNSEVTAENAKEIAQQWCEEKNKIIYGTYTYI
jgi:hypothetical protein